MAEVIEDEVLTYQEAAAVLKIGETTLRKLVAAGEVPSTKVGGSVRFSKGQLLALIRRPYSVDAGEPNTARSAVAMKFMRFMTALPLAERTVLLDILGHPGMQPEEADWVPELIRDRALCAALLGGVFTPTADG